MRIRTSKHNLRKGASSVEAAFCIPVLLLLMLGTLEICSGIFLRESLKIATYEGARSGVRRGGTPEMVRATVEEVLTARGVQGGQVTVEPNNFAGMEALEPITVTVSAPSDMNSRFNFEFLLGGQISARLSLIHI